MLVWLRSWHHALLVVNLHDCGAAVDTPSACTSVLGTTLPLACLLRVAQHMVGRLLTQIVEALAERLEAAAGSSGAGARTLLVVDPVLVATSGDALAAGGVMEAMRQHLLPAATIVTPNVPEASALLGALLFERRPLHCHTCKAVFSCVHAGDGRCSLHKCTVGSKAAAF